MSCFLRSLGWQPVTPAEYAGIWQRHGGSVITNPDILSFIQQRMDCQPAYHGKYARDGKLVGAIATWGNRLAGDKLALQHFGIEQRYDFGSPEIILPLSPEFHGIVGFRSKYLSAIHQQGVINASRHNRQRTICLAKGTGPDGMSSRQKRTRRNDLSKLLRSGGALRPVSEFSPQELAGIYAELFHRRWGHPHPVEPHLAEMMAGLWPHVAGQVLYIEDQPAAFQFLLATRSDRYYSIEFINCGIDPAFRDLTPGSVLTWVNIEQACQVADEQGLTCRYSFGRNSASYKAQWAHEVPLLRVIA